MWAARVGMLGLATVTLFAQHEATPGDIADGQQLFRASCAICHGPEGNAVPGIDFGHGKFRQAMSDAQLVHIIQKGIPGTAMPPHNFNDFRAGTVVAYMRFMAKSASDATASGGDPTHGKLVFESKGCLNCHRVRGNGSRLGPELTDIGSQRRAVELEKSILDPNAEILPQNRFFRVVTQDGATITGRLLNQDAFTIQLLDSKERLMSFSKTDLKEFAFVDKSPMPSYQGKLSPQELTDLVSFLVSLKGID
jgi:cytochrome c oxidase cbb3-type subunit 3